MSSGLHVKVEFEAGSNSAVADAVAEFLVDLDILCRIGGGNGVTCNSEDPNMQQTIRIFDLARLSGDEILAFRAASEARKDGDPDVVLSFGKYFIDSKLAHWAEGERQLICDADNPRIQNAVRSFNDSVRRIDASIRRINS